jgi:hypothetical protein
MKFCFIVGFVPSNREMFKTFLESIGCDLIGSVQLKTKDVCTIVSIPSLFSLIELSSYFEIHIVHNTFENYEYMRKLLQGQHVEYLNDLVLQNS